MKDKRVATREPSGHDPDAHEWHERRRTSPSRGRVSHRTASLSTHTAEMPPAAKLQCWRRLQRYRARRRSLARVPVLQTGEFAPMSSATAFYSPLTADESVVKT